MQRLSVATSSLAKILKTAISVLDAGGLVVYPTETMYGVGCNALNEAAVTKLLRYKERPAGKAISVLVKDYKAAEELILPNKSAEQLFRSFLPGPVTVVSASKGVVDPRLESEFHTLGIRISSHEIAHTLAEKYGKPITSTSANMASGPRPYDIDSLLEHLPAKHRQEIGLIIDAGPLPKREPSTVIDTTQEVQQIVRSGERIEELAPPFTSHSEEETQEYAKNLMHSFLHVLPEKPVLFALEGDMGLGKTQFAKGVAQALHIDRPITSPTFTLIKEYPGMVDEKTVHFIHMDLWRLEKVNPKELGLVEYIHPKYVIVVEWATPLLPYLRTLKEKAVIHRLLLQETKKHTRTIRVLPL